MSDDPNYTGRELSQGGGSCQLRDRSNETMGHCHKSPPYDRHKHHNAALDAMSRMLRKAARSPFSNEIKRIEIPRCFTRPLFTIYDRKIDLVDHVSHYISHDVTLFPERWFDVKIFPA